MQDVCKHLHPSKEIYYYYSPKSFQFHFNSLCDTIVNYVMLSQCNAVSAKRLALKHRVLETVSVQTPNPNVRRNQAITTKVNYIDVTVIPKGHEQVNYNLLGARN